MAARPSVGLRTIRADTGRLYQYMRSVRLLIHVGAEFLCDGMLGHLARWLRLLGFDTAYAGNELGDDDILSNLRGAQRILVTRDDELHRRAMKQGATSIRVPPTGLVDELVLVLRESHATLDSAAYFTRCTRCSGPLEPAPADVPVPPAVRTAGLPITRCTRCGHAYWEGTHVAEIRIRIAEVERRLAAAQEAS